MGRHEDFKAEVKKKKKLSGSAQESAGPGTAGYEQKERHADLKKEVRDTVKVNAPTIHHFDTKDSFVRKAAKNVVGSYATAYQSAVDNSAEGQWKSKYADKSYSDLKSILRELDSTSAEYEWLKSYSRGLMTLDDFDAAIKEESDKKAKLKISHDFKTAPGDDIFYNQQIKEIDAEIDSLQEGRWRLQNAEKYKNLSAKPDFEEKSAAAEDEATATFGVQFGDNWLGNGDPVYDFINNLDGTQDKAMANEDPEDRTVATLYKYAYMTDEEVAGYNYLYNVEGKKAANEYLDYLSYELDARRVQADKEKTAVLAKEYPVLMSALSVPQGLISGVGTVGAVAQKTVNDISEEITGEYAGPVNFNSWMMNPSIMKDTTRGTVAQMIADETGVVNLDEEEHPILSKLFNGKSLGDVYNLSMSMIDSATNAVVASVTGGSGQIGTLLLGGSAATSTMLEKAANGATDEQAITMGLIAGAAEYFSEKYSLDALLESDTRNIVKSLLQQGLVEGTEEVSASFVNNIADIFVMAGKSDYKKNIAAYMAMGMSEEDATEQAWIDMVIDMGWDFVGGMISGGVMGAGGAAVNTVQQNSQAKNMYGENVDDLINEALELDPNNELAHKMQEQQTAGKTVRGGQIYNLVQQNEAAIKKMGDDDNGAEAEKQNTKTLNPDEYQKIVQAAQDSSNDLKKQSSEPGTTSEGGQELQDGPELPQITSTEEIAIPKTNDDSGAKYEAVPDAESTEVQPATIEAVQEQEVEEESNLTLEDASEKYGDQAGAMIHTYKEGQDVRKYDAAYQVAYNMGRSGVNISYAVNSEATGYLSETQRELAYAAGKAAAQSIAGEKESVNMAKANGNTGWKKGSVKGEGVKISDLKETFNDTQNTAYKLLSTYAETSGINIVLFKSETDENGNFAGAQGRYKQSDPGTIYIDINAGLVRGRDVTDLAKYTMLRTFAHEFTHFIENWNPVQYNEFRKVVFDTLTQRGENVHDLIEEKQAQSPGMGYDAASREVVAEAMTDILPDANFVETLASKHKTIFDKLLEKLKEFVAKLRKYYSTIGHNRSREANALKEQVNEAVHYVDNITKLFDRVAVQAVENYQKTVAIEKTVLETEEKVAETPKQGEFEKNFREASQAERDEVVKAIDENMGKISHVYPTEIHEEKQVEKIEEVTEHGKESEDGSDDRAVHEPVRRSEGTSQLLEGVEPEIVRGSDEGREPVQSGGDQGTGDAGRDRQPDAAGTVSERGERDRVGGDLQQLQGVTEESPEAQKSNTDEAKLREVVIDLTEQKSTTQPKGSNFVIGDTLDLPNGTKSRTRANIDAIKLVKRIAAEGRYATAAEQVVLSKYVGWGGLADAFGKPVSNRTTRKIDYEPVGGLETEFEELKSVLTEEEYKAARESTKNAHYTSIEVIKAMYDGLKQIGFTGGRMLEPSSGVGNFVGAMPADMSSTVKSWTMVELDNITGMLAKYLYPNADVRIQGFEEANIPDGYMDVAIGNVPFGNYAIYDKHYPKAVTSAIHNYFFAKALDKVRPGGICMFITSAYTMNGKDNAVRKYIMQRADLMGAIRLPNTAFAGNAGTSVVTDILILKKRAARTEYAGEAFSESNWERVSATGREGAYVNEYFIQHPEMVLGKAKLTRGMYSANELTYDPYTDRGTLGDQIREALKNIKGKIDYPTQLSPERENFRQANSKKKSQKLKIKDGEIQVQDENGNVTKVEVDKDTAARITGMVAIRDAHIALCDALQQGVNKKTINTLRKTLNKAYDSFVEKYGYLNSAKNKKAINAFSDRYAILSLENYSLAENPSGKGKKSEVVSKTDIFTKDTISANRTAASAENVEEGLTISLNTAGRVDVSMIAKLTGQKAESVTRQLIDQRLVFKDRNGNLIPAVQYLSGNVRAKLREMEGLVGIDSDYKNNVEALREVVPPTVQHTDIYVNPGANWVPVSVYEDFVGHILNRTNHESWRTGKKDFSVEYVPETNEYKIVINDNYAKMSAQNTQVWGEGGKTFSLIFENMLNGRRTNVYRDAGDGKRVLDKVKTEAVAEKVEKLNEEFRKWLWDDETRRGEMQELYNETYNALVTPKYSGSSLTVNGLNSAYNLRDHQKDAVARIINSGGNTLLAHRVGAGKTMEMAAAAMKLKQLGVIKKPMFVVPNNVVAQWGKEFKDYFPAANILLVGDEDMTPAERMTTINKIKNNDYDAVILAYTKFEKIQMTTAWRQKFYEEQIDSIMYAINAEKESQGGKGFTVKQLEAKRKSLESKVKKLTDKAKDEDGAMFEDLGVDALFVDEAHNFKNLEYSTRMNNVSGLGNAEGSQRAFDMYTKVRYLQQLNGGRGIVFATATPVMNSMTEMYIMQKYLQPDTLKQLGIEHFDSWAKMFGEVVNALEIAPSGSGYRLKQTFSKFKNVKALQQLFRSFTDVLTDIPGLKIPKMKGGKVQIVECAPGEFQKNYMNELAQRSENVRNVDPSEDNMLKITSDGRKISYSQRMIDPSLPYEETGKIYQCCEKVFAVYKESNANQGTQMIFCDMATPKGKASEKAKSDSEGDEFAAVDTDSAKLYDDIKARLVQMGIPAKEIAFIHDAKNDKQKAEIAAKMNNGNIRVLIGSTGKMGVGLNAQIKAIAIHHLDAPWRPGDIEQRDGRVFRQKNENDEAYKFVYVTKGSFDSRLWDILERKQNFINQVMNGDDVGNEIEDTGEVTLSAAEVKAIASDNPLIMEQVALEKEISKLQSLQQAHLTNVTRAAEKMVSDRRRIVGLESRITAIREDIQGRKDTYSDDNVFSMQIGSQIYKDKKDAGAALVAAAKGKAKEGSYTTIGKFAGFDLRVVKTPEGINGIITGSGNYDFRTYPLNPTYGISHLISVVAGLDERLDLWNKELDEVKNDLDMQNKLATEPFEQADNLKEKRSRYNEIMDILNPPADQNVSEEGVQEQDRSYLESIKKDEVVKQGNTGNGVTQGSRSSTINLTDLFTKINPSDGSFLKYVPKQFLESESEIQFQQRTNTLTDREVLAIAANDLKIEDLTPGEFDALMIFKDRLTYLEDLQDKRTKQGRLYKEQQFGSNVDREAAAATLNRMHILDDQIKAANDAVFDVEEKAVLRKVLVKARKIVEQQERAHGKEILNRWRERRNTLENVKKYRERIKRDVDDLTNWILHPNNKDVVKHVPDALKNSVISFLASINFMSKQSLRGGNPTIADKEFVKRLNGIKAAMKPNHIAEGLYADYSDLPPNFMDRLQIFIDTTQELVDSNNDEFVINKMTSDGLKELSQLVRTLKEYIKNFNRFHVNAMFRHVYEAGDSTIAELSRMNSAGPHTGRITNYLFWQQIRPAYAFERFGDGGKAIYDEFRQGQAQLAFNTKKILEFSDKAYSEKEVKTWEKEVKTIKLSDGSTVRMPVSTVMSFYELSKRPQAMGHILGQGVRVAKRKGEKADDGHMLTLEDVDTIIETLTPRQKEVADNLQKFMQEQGGKWGNYVSVKRFGEELFGEEHYFPINSDGRYLSANADEHPSAASLYALLNMGFTKRVQKGANNRLILYSIFDVFANHMASMAQYNALALPVVDALKWFNYQQKSEPDEDGKRTVLASVRDQMDRVYGVPEEKRPGSGRQGYAQSFVINILKAFNGTAAQGAPMDELGMKGLHTYNRAQIAYDFRVVVQQPMAITRAAQLLDYASIIKGMKLTPAAIQKNITEMQKYSGIAAWKSLGFYDVNISRGLTALIKHDESWTDKVTDVGMWGAEKADVMTWAAMWSAAKMEVIRKQKLTPKDEGFYEAVTSLFEDVIYKTQVVDSILTKSEFMRDKGFWARAVASFMSEPTTTASMLIDACDKFHMDMQRGMSWQQAWKKNRRMIGRTVYVYALGAIALAAVQAVADAWRDDDDYQTFMEKWLEAFSGLNGNPETFKEWLSIMGGNAFEELVLLNKLPILSDVYEVTKEVAAKLFDLDIYGNAPQSVVMQWYDSLVKSTEILHDKISGKDTDYTWYGGAYKLLQAISGMSGLPLAATTRELVTLWNNIVSPMAPSLKVKSYDPGEKNDIKYAFEDGYLTAEEAIDELISRGLVEDENEAYWLVQGWEGGEDYSKYDAVYDAIRNGGNFESAMQELTSHGYEEKDILSNLKRQIGKWYKDGEINAQDAEEMYEKYTGLSKSEAADEVALAEFIKKNPEYSEMTVSALDNYNQYCTNVPVDVYYDAWKYKNTLSGSVKTKMMNYIHRLSLTRRQKDSMYYAFGWAESTIDEAPWH